MKKVSLVLLALVLVVSGLLITGCGGDDETTTTSTATTASTTTATTQTTTSSATGSGPKYGGILTVSEPIFPGQPLGYPPSRGFAEVLYQQPCLEPLIEMSIDGSVSPRLATDWEIADDGSSITFTLRQGVKFHDGSDLNAEVVKWNFDAEIPTQKASNIDWDSVDVIDEYTVRVNLKKYTNSTLSNFAFGGGNYIVSKVAFDEKGQEWVEQNMVGTGPFKQVDYQRDILVEYERFDDYWNEGLPYLDGIVYKAIPDSMVQIAALKTQELDGMASGADKNLADLVDAGLIATTGVLGVGGYVPDSADPSSPFADQRVREALEYAIDKEAIADAFSYGFWEPAYQWAPPTSAAYDPTNIKRTYDPDKAKELLAEAGYPDGLQFNFLVSFDEPGGSIAQAIQAQWEEIGITTNLELLESAKFEEYQRVGWSGLLYSAPTGPSNWHSTLERLLSPTGSSYISVDVTPEYIDLYNAAAESLEYDPAKEQALVTYVTENAMVIPVWNVVRAWVTQDYVKDGGFLSFASAFFWRCDTIWLDK